MEIILKQDLKNLGYNNDIVTVKNGYAINYLIPKGIAIMATESNKKMHAETLKQRAFKDQKIKDEATKLAAKLAELLVKVGAKAGENGKIFGSVSSIQLTDSLKKLGYEVDRKNIVIDGDAIKTLGKYTATAKLHRDVTATINFEVVEE